MIIETYYHGERSYMIVLNSTLTALRSAVLIKDDKLSNIKGKDITDNQLKMIPCEKKSSSFMFYDRIFEMLKYLNDYPPITDKWRIENYVTNDVMNTALDMLNKSKMKEMFLTDKLNHSGFMERRIDYKGLHVISYTVAATNIVKLIAIRTDIETFEYAEKLYNCLNIIPSESTFTYDVDVPFDKIAAIVTHIYLL